MNYHNITTDDMLNGDGLRTVLWVSGCSLHCKGCHNPQTHDFNSGIPFDDDATTELLNKLDKPYISGLTLSGGNPLESGDVRETVYKVIKEVRERFPDKTIWLYTGFTWNEIIDEDNFYEDYEVNSVSMLDVVKQCDVVVEGRYIEEKRDVTLPWRGSTNQKVIDIRQTLEKGNIILWTE